MIGRFGLEEVGNRPLLSRSKGMKRRLTIAAALTVSRKVLLLTYNIEEAESLCDRVTSSLLGLMVSVTAKKVFEVQTLSNIYRFPMIFLCGLFIPVQSLPWILQPLSYVLPITYGVDILRQGMLMDGMFETWASVTVGIGFIIVLYALSLRGIKGRWLL